MDAVQIYIQRLFDSKQIAVSPSRRQLFDEFVKEDAYSSLVQQIFTNQETLMIQWGLKNRITDILQQPAPLPNGTVGKPYQTQIDFAKYGWDDFAAFDVEGLEAVGLLFDKETKIISGTPIESGDKHIKLKFKIKGEDEDACLNEKKVSLIINPDPKTLWKNIPSKLEDAFWKEDNAAVFDKLGDRNIVVSSKRGRSHANTGGFREDDFAYKYFENTGWSIVAVADGAGSAKFSREGSRIACTTVVAFWEENFSQEIAKDFDEILSTYKSEGCADSQKSLSQSIYSHLSKAAYAVHQSLTEAASKVGANLKDFHSTLIFTLFKKYESGYAFLSFGVGDCPIAVLNKDVSEVFLLNWLDVGEFGGGTRFITMPEIFATETLSTRIKFKWLEDFSYLMLMTDGIYDPKFVVEANLEKIEQWKNFLNDLQGENEEKKGVDFNQKESDLSIQLSDWMDFWSPGNHDDRTLAIVF
jgi:Protein phosphatase 2C